MKEQQSQGEPQSDSVVKLYIKFLVMLVIVILPVAIFAYWIDQRLNAFDRDHTFQPSQDGNLRQSIPAVPEKGQLVFVPAYSHVYHKEGAPIALTITLSVRNTDPENSIVLSQVDYFNSEGSLVKRYLPQPIEIGPFATNEFLVPQSDNEGGSGANFLLRWGSETPVSPPVIETVMINTEGSQGVSFARSGIVLERSSPESPLE